MSNGDASARYIVAADDRTKATLSAIRANFNKLDSGIRSAVRGINTAFVLLAGVGLRQFHQQMLRAAEGNREFKLAMDAVRESTRNLIAGGDMSSAIAELKKLNATLRDPQVVHAAQTFSTAWITAWASMKSGAAELIVVLEKLSRTAGGRGGLGAGARLEAHRAGLAELSASPHGPGVAALEGRRLDAAGRDAGDRATRRFGVMQEYAENIKWLEQFDKDATQFEQQRKEAFKDLDEAVKKSYDENAELIHKQFSDEQDARQQLYDWRRDQEQQVQREAVESFKALWKETFQFWMHGSQRTARSFLEALLATAGNKLLMKAFDDLFSLVPSGKGGGSSSGFWGAIVSGIGSLFGGSRAGGGDIEAGKVYQVHKDEMIFSRGAGTVVPAAAFAGGVTVYNYNTFHNVRDLTDAKMAVYAERISDATIGRVQDMKRRGRL